MKRGVADGSKVHQHDIAMSLLQCDGSVDGGGGATSASFGAEEREDPGLAGASESACARGTEAGKGFEQGFGPGEVVQILAGAGAHAGHDPGRIRHVAVGKDGNLLGGGADQFDGTDRTLSIFCGN